LSLSRYIETVNNRYWSGIASEHAYRGDLEALIRALVPQVEVTNEPSKVTDCGNPDYVITRKNIPIGFIEAKDVGKDLSSKTYKEQFDRYRKALDNLIITDYLSFQFYQSGELVACCRIADIQDGNIIASSECFDEFTGLIQNFCTYIGNTIKSPKKLASMMAAKARLLQVILEKAITSDEQTQDNTALQQQFETFKDVLIHDLEPQGFADIYAQTLTYGMFAARLHDDTLDTFSRQEAAELIPKSNPFLRKLFNHVAGADIDERIKTTVDNLADVFRATDVKALLKNFGRATQTHDPIIHFYETFLAEYDPKLRKARGVWYTPEPVVNFIVRGVDEILKTEFGLKDGLADTTKTTIKLKQPTTDKRKKVDGQSGYTLVEKEVHKVQVLDPATGTGTFLAEVVKFIYNGKFKAMQGAWSSYVDEHLIPRLNGFELLMASYAMAHLKLDMLLRETGASTSSATKVGELVEPQRLNIYLTNSLEEHHPDTGTLFSSWLSTEANEANHIKRDTPVMVVMGNPPYSVSSSNKSDWIQELIKDYKKDLNERKINLDDDYIKFIRYGQHFIDKNGEGILAYISNNSFIDGVTHRQMRKHLLQSFDKIYILDLHGNSKKKETTPDGRKDENVFDIMQGVSINIFVKKNPGNNVTHAKVGVHSKQIDSRLHGNDATLAEVYHFDLFGLRERKYATLCENSLLSLGWKKLISEEPYYFFTRKDFAAENKYQEGFDFKKIFKIFNSGIKTDRDKLFVDIDEDIISARMEKLLTGDFEESFINEFNVRDSGSYKITKKIQGKKYYSSSIQEINYRPFDVRWEYYDPTIISRSASRVMKHVANQDNITLQTTRFNRQLSLGYFFVSNCISDIHLLDSAADSMQVFPLYIYPEADKQQNLDNRSDRKPNLDNIIVETIANGLGLTFVPEKNPLMEKEGLGEIPNTFAPIDLLDYIYAVLHSPTYRETYKEFLKIDFPRIPYPKDAKLFWRLVKLGGELRQIHLLESPTVENYITRYPADGDNIISRKITKTNPGYEPVSDTHGKVWINDTQYFEDVPLIAWEFYIGGYQPAQKWLKDRTGRKLSFDDILHYQKIIVALTETGRIMQEIDEVDLT